MVAKKKDNKSPGVNGILSKLLLEIVEKIAIHKNDIEGRDTFG